MLNWTKNILIEWKYSFIEYCYNWLAIVNPGVLIGSFLVGILPYGPFPWKWSYDVYMYFLFSKAGNFETSITRVPYNKLLTNLACSSCTGEYWPLVVFVRTSLRLVHTATTSGQYSPVRSSRSVSKRLFSIKSTQAVARTCSRGNLVPPYRNFHTA